MTSLQLGLIAAGAAARRRRPGVQLVQERRVRRRIRERFARRAAAGPRRPGASRRARIEPSLPRRARPWPSRENARGPPPAAGRRRLRAAARSARADCLRSGGRRVRGTAPLGNGAGRAGAAVDRTRRSPTPTSSASSRCSPPGRWRPARSPRLARAPRKAAALVRPARCRLPWQLLKSDTRGEFSEIAACLLLADRAGAASEALIEAFVRAVAGSRRRCRRRCRRRIPGAKRRAPRRSIASAPTSTCRSG